MCQLMAIMNKRGNKMNNKTYDELYKEDVQKIKEWINNSSPFSFTKYRNDDWQYRNYYINDAVSEFVETTLNPTLLYKKTIEEIEKLQKNLYHIEDHRSQYFTTNIGTINASYCFIGNDKIIFYNRKKYEVASFNKDIISFIQDVNKDLNGDLDIKTVWEVTE